MFSRFSHLLRICPVLVVAFALPAAALGCAETVNNDAPIIDSVEAPLAVTEQNGIYRIPVTVLFHDNDGEAVTRLRYRLPPNIDGMIDVPAPNPALESAQLTIVIAAADLDDAPSTTVAGYNDDEDHLDKSEEAKGERARAKNRGRARALHLSIVDGRGAESLPQSSTVTLY